MATRTFSIVLRRLKPRNVIDCAKPSFTSLFAAAALAPQLNMSRISGKGTRLRSTAESADTRLPTVGEPVKITCKRSQRRTATRAACRKSLEITGKGATWRQPMPNTTVKSTIKICGKGSRTRSALSPSESRRVMQRTGVTLSCKGQQLRAF
ncbi:hypothetical protein CYMTET_47889 [Cymbomonas tetramitiformis]|uniref:Uncharacterized protein n=1 Tax=Cymbomonas tetramitiformis TaxID=36881 RepID=A0AAE0EW99_9CHLO|nr:hypothetical protein CYMTET_47889 [Cymbomonas tetramitiformis]